MNEEDIKKKREELEEEISEHLKKCVEFSESVEGYKIMLNVAKDIFESEEK